MRGGFALAALGFGLPSLVSATTPKVVAPYSLKEQLRRSDLIAFVQVTAEDSVNRTSAMYKANVIDSVKGAQALREICFTLPVFGTSLQIAGDYLVFLTQEPNVVSETASRLACPLGVNVYRIGERFSPPWAVLFTRDVRQLCPKEDCPFGDWALQVGDYPDLPEFAVTYPVQGHDRVRWIRRSQLLRALRIKLARESE